MGLYTKIINQLHSHGEPYTNYTVSGNHGAVGPVLPSVMIENTVTHSIIACNISLEDLSVNQPEDVQINVIVDRIKETIDKFESG